MTGGTRGIGAGIVEALRDYGADVTVVARTGNARHADITDEKAAHAIIGEVKPEILVLNAGAVPAGKLLDEMSWEEFTRTWDVDVKGNFTWIREALRAPLPSGSRVIVVSSGAAVQGSPMSGGYAGAKRMCWLMARYANTVSKEKKLGIHFQALVVRQMLPDGEVGRSGAEAYAKRRGISVAEQFAGFGKALTPRAIGDSIVTMLTDPQHSDADVRGIKGDLGLHALEG